MTIRHAFTNPKADGGDATVARPSDWNADHVVEGLSGGTAAIRRLDYTYAGSDISGSAISANTWTNLVSDQPFTIGSANSLIEFVLKLSIQIRSTGSDKSFILRFLIDGTTPLEVSGSHFDNTNYYGLPGGSGFLTGLTAGSHTVRLQVYIEGGAGDFYLRPAASTEFLGMEVVEHGTISMRSSPGVAAYHSTSQGSLAAATYNALSLDSEEWDTDGFHDTVTNNTRLTVPTGLAGKYFITANGFPISVASSLYLYKNGAGPVTTENYNIASKGVALNTVMDLVAGDYIELREYHATGTNSFGGAGADIRTRLSMTRLGGDSTADSVIYDPSSSGLGATSVQDALDEIVEGGHALGFVGARAYPTSATLAANTTFTDVVMHAETFDTDGFHDTSSNQARMTIPAGLGGKYLVIGQLDFGAVSGGERIVRLLVKNAAGADVAEIGWVRLDVDSVTEHAAQVSGIYDMEAGWYVTLQGYHSNGSNLNMAVSNRAWIALYKLDAPALGSPPGVRAITNATFDLTTAVEAAVPFAGTDEFDTDGFHNPSTNNTRLTIPAGLGGKYLIGGWIAYTANATGDRWAAIRKGGSTSLAFQRNSALTLGTAATRISVNTVADLVAGEYVELMAYQNSGGSTVDATEAAFWLTRLGGGPGLGDTAWTAPTLLSSWVNFGSPWATAGYRKDGQGYVHIKGLIKSGTTTPGTSLFVLPVGYRPVASHLFSGQNSSETNVRIDVQADGNVVVNGGASATYTSLEGIVFLAEG